MPLIDPDGMYNGDRLACCSTEAKLAWPWIYMAANGYARFEINYLRIAAKCFSNFHPCPAREQVFSWIAEYIGANLLYVWPVGRQLWGAWDTSSSRLPTFKTRKDQESPAPKDEDVMAWKVAYRTGNKEFAKDLVSIFKGFLHSIGEEVVLERFKNISPSELPQPTSEVIPPSTEPEPKLELAPQEPQATKRSKPVRDADPPGFSDFWEERWRSDDRAAAVKAFRKKAASVAKLTAIMVAVRKQKHSMLLRDKDKRPYMSTWLNKERFADEEEIPQLLLPGQCREPPEERRRAELLAGLQIIDRMKGRTTDGL
jgi:hypothetical protein